MELLDLRMLRAYVLERHAETVARTGELLDALQDLYGLRAVRHDEVAHAEVESSLALELARILLGWTCAGGGLSLDRPETAARRVESGSILESSHELLTALASPTADAPATEATAVASNVDAGAHGLETPDEADAASDAAVGATPPSAPRISRPSAARPASAKDVARLRDRFTGVARLAPSLVSKPPTLSASAEKVAWSTTMRHTLVEMSTVPEYGIEKLRWLAAHLDPILDAPNHVRVMYVEWLAAELRVLAEKDAGVDIGPPLHHLRAHLKMGAPGRAHGLARKHQPRHGKWKRDGANLLAQLRAHLACAASAATLNHERCLHDLRQALDAGLAPADQLTFVRRALASGLRPDDARLVRLVTPIADALDTTDLRDLRRAVRSAEPQSDHDENGVDFLDLPDDAPVLSMTRDRRAVVLGGSARPHRVEALKRMLRLAEVEWLSEPSSPDCNRIKARLANGNLDLVISIRAYVSHRVDYILRPACKAAGAPFVIVETGYGAGAIRRALEERLQAPPRVTEATG